MLLFRSHRKQEQMDSGFRRKTTGRACAASTPHLEIFRKMLQRAAHRIRRQPAHARTASRTASSRTDPSSSDDVPVALDAGADAVDHFDAARRADPARRALAAGFDRAELHRVARLFEPCRPCRRTRRCRRGRPSRRPPRTPRSRRRVELRFGHVRAERPADLDRADRAAGAGAAAVVVQQLAQRHAERLLDQSAVLEVAGELDRQRAARPAHAVVAIERRRRGRG